MNPAIVIPSYWARDDLPTDIGELGTYDHVTPVDKPLPELEMCLASLDKVRGVLRTIVLLVAPPDCEASARARVEGICRMHPGLNPMIVGQEEARLVRRVINSVAPSLSAELVSLRGYGAIRQNRLLEILRKHPQSFDCGCLPLRDLYDALRKDYASFLLPTAAMIQKTTRATTATTYQMTGLPPKKSIICPARTKAMTMGTTNFTQTL